MKCSGYAWYIGCGRCFGDGMIGVWFGLGRGDGEDDGAGGDKDGED